MTRLAIVAGVPVSTDHWIGGKRVPSRERFAVHSPIDGAPLAEAIRKGTA